MDIYRFFGSVGLSLFQGQTAHVDKAVVFKDEKIGKIMS